MDAAINKNTLSKNVSTSTDKNHIFEGGHYLTAGHKIESTLSKSDMVQQAKTTKPNGAEHDVTKLSSEMKLMTTYNPLYAHTDSLPMNGGPLPFITNSSSPTVKMNPPAPKKIPRNPPPPYPQALQPAHNMVISRTHEPIYPRPLAVTSPIYPRPAELVPQHCDIYYAASDSPRSSVTSSGSRKSSVGTPTNFNGPFPVDMRTHIGRSPVVAQMGHLTHVIPEDGRNGVSALSNPLYEYQAAPFVGMNNSAHATVANGRSLDRIHNQWGVAAPIPIIQDSSGTSRVNNGLSGVHPLIPSYSSAFTGPYVMANGGGGNRSNSVEPNVNALARQMQLVDLASTNRARSAMSSISNSRTGTPSQRQKPPPPPYLGKCQICTQNVIGADEACQAMGTMFHTKCFVCSSCGKLLRGKSFYNVQSQVFCEDCYNYCGFQQTAEKCYECQHLIVDTVLVAMGRHYHPSCFKCCMCVRCLDGIPFTVDMNNRVYCLEDYHRTFAPKCSKCSQPIVPVEGTETVRVVSMDRDFHVDCYHCEDCNIQLTDEPEKRCYPLKDSLLCYQCHMKRTPAWPPNRAVISYENVPQNTPPSRPPPDYTDAMKNLATRGSPKPPSRS